jgi:hypothetical protein
MPYRQTKRIATVEMTQYSIKMREDFKDFLEISSWKRRKLEYLMTEVFNKSKLASVKNPVTFMVVVVAGDQNHDF